MEVKALIGQRCVARRLSDKFLTIARVAQWLFLNKAILFNNISTSRSQFTTQDIGFMAFSQEKSYTHSSTPGWFLIREGFKLSLCNYLGLAAQLLITWHPSCQSSKKSISRIPLRAHLLATVPICLVKNQNSNSPSYGTSTPGRSHYSDSCSLASKFLLQQGIKVVYLLADK